MVSLKILGLVCSPRKGGNTEILVKRTLEAAKKKGADIEAWSIADKEIRPCNHCSSCIQSGECSIKDDMKQLYPKLLEADGILLGTPVYFWAVSAQAKLVIDRTYALRYPTTRARRLQDKVGGGIAVAGRRGQINALTMINNFFLGHGMIPAGLGVDARGSEKGTVNNDERALDEAIQLASRMVELIQRPRQSALTHALSQERV